MRREQLYLADIVASVKAIETFLAGIDEKRFAADDLIRSAVLHKLTIVGEAASRVSPQFRDSHPQIPWRSIIAFRNVAVHAYFSVDWSLIWNDATADAPALARQIEEVLRNEFPPAAAT